MKCPLRTKMSISVCNWVWNDKKGIGVVFWHPSELRPSPSERERASDSFPAPYVRLQVSFSLTHTSMIFPFHFLWNTRIVCSSSTLCFSLLNILFLISVSIWILFLSYVICITHFICQFVVDRYLLVRIFVISFYGLPLSS